MNTQSIVGERIKGKRKELRLNQEDLAQMVDVARQTVSSWERGGFIPEGENLRKIASALKCSSSFLLGETDDPTPQYSPQKQQVVSNVAPINLAHMIRIKVLPRDFKVCCGNGIDWRSEAIDFEETLILPLADLARRYSDGDVLAVYAEGNSMEPKIGDGDLVLFVPHEKEVLSAGIMMVVNYNGRMIIRGVIENNRKQITLRAMNKEYEDIVVTPDDDFTICGRVVKIHALKDPVSVL